ncbi:ABC transporter substrate-binding protein [Cryobacterium sp. TMS1-13-1]|uniref:ABC transporter substrate-binding protein n=1 Tax=Cryobacterium sp. TMS1-13-1 TaxID=1259220 RepID=UPI001F544552|nr:extracellular solute-binding protein [Cryobacterium sp. TMS1-13-1]
MNDVQALPRPSEGKQLMASQFSGVAFTRRGFIGVAGGLAAAGLLAACTSSEGGSGGVASGDGEIKFWNMPWGNTEFNKLDEQITGDYVPTAGMGAASYQIIQWANFTQTFSAAVASNTGPAVSSGGGTQAFQFESQDKIAYADNLIESWKANGLYDDFLPGLIDTMKVEKGYAAVPYNLDMRVMWYNKSLMEKAGAKPPTDWQGYIDAAAALKKIDVYGYGTAAGAGSFTGSHVLTGWMVNNGGGLFDEEQQPNCVTPANIEAMEFVLEMVKKGYVDPASVTYTSANADSQWAAGAFGLGFDGGGLAANVGGDVGPQLVVGSPLTSPAGTKGSLYFPNNIMMYKNSPSQEASEAFLTYYYQNMKSLWTEGTGIGLPPLKSITETPEFKTNANNVTIINEWQPIARTWAAPGGDALFLGVTAVDGTPAMETFTQSILGGRTDAKSALTALQTAIEASLAS